MQWASQCTSSCIMRFRPKTVSLRQGFFSKKGAVLQSHGKAQLQRAHSPGSTCRMKSSWTVTACLFIMPTTSMLHPMLADWFAAENQSWVRLLPASMDTDGSSSWCLPGCDSSHRWGASSLSTTSCDLKLIADTVVRRQKLP